MVRIGASFQANNCGAKLSDNGRGGTIEKSGFCGLIIIAFTQDEI